MKYAALIFGDDERQPKSASSKLSSPEPGQIVRGIDGSVYRVASKIAGPDGYVVKFANLRGEPAKTPLNFRPVGFAVAHFASWLRYHLAYNRDFDLYINSYIERYNEQHPENPLPYPTGHDGKAFRWANWFQSVVSPKLFVPGQGDVEDQQAIKDELIHEMLFTVLGHRDVLSQFVAKDKSLKVNKQNASGKLTDFLISTFMYRIDEMQKKIQERMPEEEVSMWQHGETDEGEGETNILEQEEFGIGEEEFQSAEARKDISKFRDGFNRWLMKPSVAGKKGAENFILLFDLFWGILQDTEDLDIKRGELEKEWIERTGLSFGSFREYFMRLPDMIEQFIMSHSTELGDSNLFIDLMNVIRAERTQRERKEQRKKQRAKPALVSSLNTAAVEGEYNPYATYDRLKKKYDDTHEVSYEGGRARVVRKKDKLTCTKCHRTSDASDSNNLQCPHCGGNMKTASTGLNCNFIEFQPGKWYYLLENWNSPKGGWDWREYADAYGPFSSEDAAIKHLHDNHANPGGYSIDGYKPEFAKDEVLTKLISEAHSPNPPRRSRWGSLSKTAQQLVRGDQLTPEMVKQVQEAFIYRWTSDNKRRGDVYHCDKCDVRNSPYVNTTSAEGHQHPTVPLQTDDEWLNEHAFYFTNAGKLLPRMHAVPSYLAPPEPITASLSSKFAMEKAAYNPGKGEYIYQSSLYCEPCGQALKRRLDKQGYTPANPEDEASYDSDKYPKGPYYNQEADGPQHCTRCGMFLENPLTEEGYRYLNQMILEHEEDGKGQDDTIDEWKAFYPEREEAEYRANSEIDDTLSQVEQDTDKDFLREMRTSADITKSKKRLPPNTVIREVCDHEGRSMGYVHGGYDGTPEDMVRVAQKITDQMWNEYNDASNSESRIFATDETGKLNWRISPNFLRVVEGTKLGALDDDENACDTCGGDIQDGSCSCGRSVQKGRTFDENAEREFQSGYVPKKKRGMIPHEFNNADGQAIRTETNPMSTDYVEGEADTTEFRQPRMSADKWEPTVGVGQTIYQQLGGNKFKVMTGAKNFFAGPNDLTFRLPGSGGFAKDGINAVQITLDPDDTYTMAFSRIRGSDVRVVSMHRDVYAENLRDVFEDATGLRTSLGKQGAGSNSGNDDDRGAGDLWRENFYEHRTEGLSSDGLMSGLKQAVDPSSVLNVAPPKKRVPLHERPEEPSLERAHSVETRDWKEPEQWQCMDCGAKGLLDPKGGGCETCGSQAVFSVPPSDSESPELVRETTPIETEKRMIPRRSPRPLPLTGGKKAEYTQEDWERDERAQYDLERVEEAKEFKGDDDEEGEEKTAQGAGGTTVTMQNQNATIPSTPGKAQPLAVPDAIDQVAGPHSPNAPATAPRTPAIQPRIVGVPPGTEGDDTMSVTGALNEDDPACPKCGSINIDIDETEDGYSVYCEDCERVTWTGQPSSGTRLHAEEPEVEFESEPESAPFDEELHTAAGGDNPIFTDLDEVWNPREQAPTPEEVEILASYLMQSSQVTSLPSATMLVEKWKANRFPMSSEGDQKFLKSLNIKGAVAPAPAPVISPNVQQNQSLVQEEAQAQAPNTSIALIPQEGQGQEDPGTLKRHTVEPELPNAKYHMMGTLVASEKQRLMKQAFGVDTPACRQCGEVKPDVMWHVFEELGDINDPTQALEGFYCEDCALEIAQDI